MWPVLWNFGPFSLSTYGVLVALGWLIGVRWLARHRADMGLTLDQVWDIVYWVFGGAFLGGKILYFLVSPGSFEFTLDALRYGFVFYGGLIGGILAGLSYTRRRKLPFLKLADWCVTAIALGHGIGRLGCFAAGCCYGRHTDLPWGVAMAGDISRHPAMIYESILNFVLFGLLSGFALPRVSDGRWRRGDAFVCYLIGYSLLRFAVEFFRGDDRGAFIVGLSPSQWIALAALIATFAVRRKFR